MAKTSEWLRCHCPLLLASLSLVLTVAWWIVYYFARYQAETPAPAAVVNGIPYSLGSDGRRVSDVMHAAYTLGRLDFVAVALTLLAVVLAIGAFMGFWLIRSAAVNAVREEVGSAIRHYVTHNTDAFAASVAKELQGNSRFIYTLASQQGRLQADGSQGEMVSPSDADELARSFGEDQ